MSVLSVILFFVYTWGSGFSLIKLFRIARESESAFERQIMRIGIGLCSFIVLGIALNTFRVPLDWRIFLFISAAIPAYSFFKNKLYSRIGTFRPSFRLKLRHSTLQLIAVLAIFAFSVFMYVSGAFRYNYLEDDDPWAHARGVKYVAIEKTAFANPYLNSQYIDPYPPSYDLLFGILHQTNSSVYWTMKFFNALIIALSIIFFYFFAKEFTGSGSKALFATFVLASIPAYLSHFIWAPALAMGVFFPAMYAFEMVKHDRKWWVAAAVGVASILLSHPTHAAKLLGLVAIYLAVKAVHSFFADKKSWLLQNVGNVKAVTFGAALSLLWWGLKWRMFANVSKAGLRGGAEAAAEAIQKSQNIFAKVWTLVTRVLSVESGTATRVYTFRDFVVAHSANMINNPVGLGIFASLLLFIGVISAFVKAAKLLPRPKVVLAAAAVFVVLFSVIIASKILDYQQNMYEWRKSTEPESWFAQFWPSPPAYSDVFALSLVLTALLAAFVLSLVSLVKAAKSGKNETHMVFLTIVLGWLLFAFLGINSRTFNLPVGLFAFRFWMIFAVPAALIAAEGFFALLGSISLFRLDATTASAAKMLLIAIVVVGVLFTSARQKYDVNTACWPAGAFWSGNYALEPGSKCPVPSELLAYSWLRTLPQKTKVFTFSSPDQVIGFDKFMCGWCEPEVGMRQRFYNVTPSELSGFMREKGYEYVIIGGIEARSYGFNETVSLINRISSSSLFSIAHQEEAAVVFRVV